MVSSEDGISLHVIRDTNVYRKLGPVAFNTLKEREKHLGVAALANYFVAAELLYHLSDPADPDRYKCFRALQRLASDCAATSATPPVVNFVADSEAQVCDSLFRVKPERRSQELSLMGGTLGAVAQAAHPDELQPWDQEIIRAVAEHIRRTKKRFTVDMFERVVRSVTPEAKDWEDARQPGPLRDEILRRAGRGESLPLIAEAYVIKAARDANVSVFPHELSAKARLLLEWFPTPVHAYDDLVRRVILDGLRVGESRHANSIWDIQVAFSTAAGARIGGVPLWLITDDRLILRARVPARTEAWILSSAEYEATLADPGTFAERLQRS